LTFLSKQPSVRWRNPLLIVWAG